MMKHQFAKSIAVIVLFLLLYPRVFAQPWNSLIGNSLTTTEYLGALPGSTIPMLFMHQANGTQSRFEWYTTNGTLSERMRLTQPGWLGLGTTNPLAKYHQHIGDWLLTSDIVLDLAYSLPGPFTIPISGNGAREVMIARAAMAQNSCYLLIL